MSTPKMLKNWLDAVLLFIGIFFVALGIFLIYIPAGFIWVGVSSISLALVVAKKAAMRR